MKYHAGSTELSIFSILMYEKSYPLQNIQSLCLTMFMLISLDSGANTERYLNKMLPFYFFD